MLERHSVGWKGAQETHESREFADLFLLICSIRKSWFDILATETHT